MPPNVLLVCVDTLRRDALGAYRDRPVGFDYEVETPALDAFAERAATFDGHYASSMPTIPTRREYLTGVQEFLWRGWGGVEPYDTTLTERLEAAGVPSALVTDNYHYFEQRTTGGYHESFTGFELVRGHEGDAWKTAPAEPDAGFCRQVGADDPRDLSSMRAQYARNVADFDDEEAFFAPRTFSQAADWVRENAGEWDTWFLMVDSFDVHEPFHCPEPYASMYTDEDPTDPDLPAWHEYGWLDDDYWTDRKLAFTRAQYAGKVTMVDRWFGRLLDALEEAGVREETTVVFTSDHGHCLGDHGYVGKNEPPIYDELARLPLLVDHPGGREDRVDALTSALDLHATLADLLGVDTDAPHSESFADLLDAGGDDHHRERALYGYYGRSVNVTDGRYTYLHPTDPDGPLASYSQYAPRPETYLAADPGGGLEVASLPYTDAPVWRAPDDPVVQNEEPLLFDVREDPDQTRNLADERPGERERMRDLLATALEERGAPEEQFERLGLR